MPAILLLGKPRQEFEASLGYLYRKTLSQKKKTLVVFGQAFTELRIASNSLYS